MPTNLQPILSCREGVSSDVSVFLNHADTTYDVYISVALLERVGVDPKIIQHKMLVGRLFNAGVSLRELADSFDHDPRTIKKWGVAMLSGDIEKMARAFAGRGGTGKVTPELIRYGRQLFHDRYFLGKNYREIIIAKIAEVFRVTISPTIASGIFKLERNEFEATLLADKMATTEAKEGLSSTKTDPPVKRSPTPLPAQNKEGGTAPEQLIHHAGQAIFTNEMKGISDPLQRQIIGQILQGAVNVEQSKTICGRSLANFTGPVLQTLKQQRDAINAQAGPEGVLGVYGLNADLLVDGPNRGLIFYFDPHTKAYTGFLKILKSWCGSRHAIAKLINLDAFHTLSGRPCFIQHYSPYYDMRARFFMSLRVFDQLFDKNKRRGRTFVIDRGIYGLATLQSFGEDYFITWEKNYSGDGWDDDKACITFTRSLKKNHSDDHRFVTLQCQESVWRRDSSFRRIIVRISHPGRKDIQVSILTSNPDMDVQDVVWTILRRWLQENDFKYLDIHFGINQMTSRDSFSFLEKAECFQDQTVASLEYRELRNGLHALEDRLGKQLVLLHKSEKEQQKIEVRQAKMKIPKAKLEARAEVAIERLKQDKPLPRNSKNISREMAECRRTCKKFKSDLLAKTKKREKLQKEIVSIEKEIEPLEFQLCNAVRKESRLQLLIDGNYRLLDTRQKSMMDALRVISSNMFRNVQEQFRAIYKNFRDDHVLVRMLSRVSGSMTRTTQTTIFKLWLPGTLQPHRIRAFKTLLKEIEEQTNSRITSARPICLRLATGPISV